MEFKIVSRVFGILFSSQGNGLSLKYSKRNHRMKWGGDAVVYYRDHLKREISGSNNT